jgi:IS30 family transposase
MVRFAHIRPIFAHKSHRLEVSRGGASFGLLRQYFPKGSDLSTHTEAELDEVARLKTHRLRHCQISQKPCKSALFRCCWPNGLSVWQQFGNI